MGTRLRPGFEARSCERSKSKNECGGLSSMAGLALAKLCYDMILEHGVAAKRDCQNKTHTPALYRIVEANIHPQANWVRDSGWLLPTRFITGFPHWKRRMHLSWREGGFRTACKDFTFQGRPLMKGYRIFFLHRKRFTSYSIDIG
jgi:hypothetical protein